MITLLKIILTIAIVYIVYVLGLALCPYFIKKEVNYEFKQGVDNYNFYGDEECVDRVALVEDPPTSLGSRIRLLSEAEKTIDVAYYALHMGETTDYFLAALLDAADRGVKVRFLIDGMFHGFSGEYKDLAKALGSHPNIEIKLYNVINPLKPWTFNGRMHDKYIIIDNKVMLLGGRNIGDKYFGVEGYNDARTIDRDVMVYNTDWDSDNKKSCLFEVRSYMMRIWNGKYAKVSFDKETEKSKTLADKLRKISKTMRKENEELFNLSIDFEENTFPTNKVTFFANDMKIFKKEPKVGYIIRELASKAKTRVFLQSPYVVLSENIYYALKAVGESSAEYEILTNSMQSSPNVPAFSLYLSDRKKIVETGAKIYEFRGEDSIHAKTYIIDDRMSIIGSFNLDPRSEYIDTEIMLAIDSKSFTEYMWEIVGYYKEHSIVTAEKGNFIEDKSLDDDKKMRSKKRFLHFAGKIISPFRSLI